MGSKFKPLELNVESIDNLCQEKLELINIERALLDKKKMFGRKRDPMRGEKVPISVGWGIGELVTVGRHNVMINCIMEIDLMTYGHCRVLFHLDNMGIEIDLAYKEFKDHVFLEKNHRTIEFIAQKIKDLEFCLDFIVKHYVKDSDIGF